MSLVKFYTKPLYNHAFNHFFNRDINKVVGTDTVKNSPLVNISELNGDYLIEVAAPGLNKEDLKIDIDKQLLTVKADVAKETNTEDATKYTRKEFGYSSFKRSFTLPESVDTQKVNAKYENGILSIHLPQKEEAKPKPAREINIG
ncbi:Hsp20/alpha crystallin family protein [uncultured Microscilla sp.]|uniref:Hsp20/alpha crystallin family protein n=1 Tax=uncultured Microscilla sp. TaxID=432653 RepID=UPI00260FC33D|nr:Hsp20/alpha crystallin family protein [uncultured Microscilla sp.]